MVTLEEVKKNEEVEALIKGAQKQLDGLQLHSHACPLLHAHSLEVRQPTLAHNRLYEFYSKHL